MQTHILSTPEIAALRRLNRDVDSRWVDWAVNMLVDGHDSPSLMVLAGESAPFNQFKMAELVDRTLEELGIRQHDAQEDAARAYALVCVRLLLDGLVPKDAALLELAQLCMEFDYSKDFYDFYLFHYARMDLQEYEDQRYWPDATRENIDEIIEDYCRKWASEQDTDV